MSTQQRRPAGRPPLSPEQKAHKEGTIDTHMNIPVSIIEKIDRLRTLNESRKDFVVRVLREYPE
jgi:hypothetical protein